MIKTKIILPGIVNKLVISYIILIFLTACEKNNISDSISKENSVFIIFDYNEANTNVNENQVKGKTILEILRKNPSEPNLRINISQVINSKEMFLSKKDLKNFIVMQDSEMDYQAWFELDYENYFLISEQEFTKSNEGNLTAIEVLINVSGLE